MLKEQANLSNQRTITQLHLYNQGIVDVVEYRCTDKEMQLVQGLIPITKDEDCDTVLKTSLEETHRMIMPNLNIIVMSRDYKTLEKYLVAKYYAESETEGVMKISLDLEYMTNMPDDIQFYRKSEEDVLTGDLTSFEAELVHQTKEAMDTKEGKPTFEIKAISYYGYTFLTVYKDDEDLYMKIRYLDTILGVPDEYRKSNIRKNSIFQVETETGNDLKIQYDINTNKPIRYIPTLHEAYSKGIYPTFVGTIEHSNLIKEEVKLKNSDSYLMVIETEGKNHTVMRTRDMELYKKCIDSISKNNIKGVMDEVFYSNVSKKDEYLQFHNEITQYKQTFGVYPNTAVRLNIMGYELLTYLNVLNAQFRYDVLQRHLNRFFNVECNTIFYYKPEDKMYIETGLSQPNIFEW